RRGRRRDSQRGADAPPGTAVSVVMKFGGTSVADPPAINRLIGIVRRQRESEPSNSPAPVVVVSALSGVTDALIAVTRQAEEGDAARAARAPTACGGPPRQVA